MKLRGCWLGSFSSITSSLYAQELHSFTAGAHLQVSWVSFSSLAPLFVIQDLIPFCRILVYPSPFPMSQPAWVLGALAQANHRVNRCSAFSLLYRRRASSSVLGIYKEVRACSMLEKMLGNAALLLIFYIASAPTWA